MICNAKISLQFHITFSTSPYSGVVAEGDYGCHSIYVLSPERTLTWNDCFCYVCFLHEVVESEDLKENLVIYSSLTQLPKLSGPVDIFTTWKTSLGSTAHVSSSQLSPFTTPYISRLTENQDLLVSLFAYVWIFYRHIFMTIWQIYKIRKKNFLSLIKFEECTCTLKLLPFILGRMQLKPHQRQVSALIFWFLHGNYTVFHLYFFIEQTSSEQIKTNNDSPKWGIKMNTSKSAFLIIV